MGLLTFAKTSDPDPQRIDPVPLDAPQEEYEDVGTEVADTLVSILPWGISALLHVGIFLLASFVVYGVAKTVQQELPIIPDVRLSDAPISALTMIDRERVQQTSQQRTITFVPQERPSVGGDPNAPKGDSKNFGGAGKVSLQTLVIGVAGQGGGGGGTNPFGVGAGTGDGKYNTSYFGSGGNARTIAFVIDASGSLIDTLPLVISELTRTLNELQDAQSFTVLFFQGDQVVETPPPGLKQASLANRTKALEFLATNSGNIIPRGSPNAVPAISRALSYRPQLLYILAANITGKGRYELDQRSFITQVKKANIAGTKINCIQFLYPDPLATQGRKGTLEELSNATGGRYKFVSAEELGLENRAR